MRLKYSIIIVLLSIFFYSCTPTKNEYKVENGYLDLSSYNFKDGAIDLRGDWEFYWKKFYSPEDFKSNNIQATQYIKMPSLWNKIETDSFIISSDGYATMRLIVKLSEVEEILSMRLGRIETTYKLYINGDLVKQVGTPGKTIETSIPSWDRTNVDFYCDTNQLEIILQISNFHHKKIGTSGTIVLGDLTTVRKKSNTSNYFNIFLIGVLLIVALYHFGLYILRTEDKASLFFAIFNITVAIVSLFYGDILFEKIFPRLSWQLSVNILYLAYFTAMASFTLFIYKLFTDHFNKKIIYGIVTIQLLLAIITITTSVKIFSFTMIFFQISAIVSLLFFLLGLVIATIKKEEGAFYSALALVVFISTTINDVLLDAILINSIYLLSLGTFAFVFLQSFTISLRFSRLFLANKNLTLELNEINKTLEDRVKRRTAKIEMQKEELSVQADNLQEINHEINQQKEELIAQSEVLERANKEISEQNAKIEKQNEDITKSIIYARRIQHALLPSEQMFDENFSDYYILFKPRNIVSGDFYWMRKIKNKLLIAVADCTGHGVPGAFVSMLGISLLNEIVRRNEINSTNFVLDAFRDQLKEALRHNNSLIEIHDGIDMTFCALDVENKELEFSGANNSMYIIRQNTPEHHIETSKHKNAQNRNNKLFHITADRQPIGEYFMEKDFTKQRISLKKDDYLVFFTDGFHDQFNEEGTRKYYSRIFKKFLLSICEYPFKEQQRFLDEELKKWKGNNRQTDDILIVGLKI